VIQKSVTDQLLAEREKRIPSAGRKGRYNIVTIFNFLSLQKKHFLPAQI
jgi:hypothetical protein